MDRPKNAAIAKWGAACSPCALAKAKCLRSSDIPGARCDSKTAQLEERLNNLVDFIKANNSRDTPTSPTQAAESRIPARSSTPIPISGPNNHLSSSVPNYYNEQYPIANSCFCSAPRTCVCRIHDGEAPIPLEPLETPLSIYMDKLLPNYPFVAFPPGTTASELESRRPFLFTTIRMVASYRNLKSMRSQNYLILRHISEQMLMRSERSLETLQSILLVLGYYHYHCMIHAQMNNLIGLANSLVADLGINKDPELQEKIRLLQSNPEAPRARTNDERRALCGVWYMTSIISLAFQRIDSPRYTTYIDQCLRELEADGEYQTDLLLVHLVRIQHLSERIAQLHIQDHLAGDPAEIARAPVSAYSGIFHAELEKFVASLPQDLASNRLIMCHINTAKLRLFEPPRIDAALLEKISNSLASLSLESASSLDIFYRASAALKSWFEDWLSIEVTDYFVLPMPMSAQLINAVTMLARWSKLSSPGRNFTLASTPAAGTALAQIVRNDPSCSGAAMMPVPPLGTKDIDPAIPAAVHAIRTHLLSQPALYIDVPGILQAMASRFEKAREVSEKQGDLVWENDTWDMAAKKIKGTRLKLERWAELVAAADSERRKPESSVEASIPAESDLSNGQGIEGNWPMAPSGTDIYMQPTHEAWSPGVLWTNDFFDGFSMDQSFFFDGPGDYGTNVINNF
ncbi:putative C6 transcription factor [Hypoxylon sp. EC38]|nr:putative C6 transcription factor [Hypoxylon sp. EC38]